MCDYVSLICTKNFSTMPISKIRAIFFSPTGGTARIVEHAAQTLAARLGVLATMQSYTTPNDRGSWQPIEEGEMVVWGTPVYAGRIPNKTLDFVDSHLKGCNNPVLAIAVYGGRHYDDTLAEMQAVIRRGNMRCVGATAMVCRHVFSNTLGLGRPSGDDLSELEAYCLHMDLNHEVCHLPGHTDNLQYYTPLRTDSKPAQFLKAVPMLNAELCTKCGQCASWCPMGSITNREGVPSIEGICIKCMACVRGCVNGAWRFDNEDFFSHIRMIEQQCQAHAPNWFADTESQGPEQP